MALLDLFFLRKIKSEFIKLKLALNKVQILVVLDLTNTNVKIGLYI